LRPQTGPAADSVSPEDVKKGSTKEGFLEKRGGGTTFLLGGKDWVS
jgi:hypothetical protein